MSQLYVSLSAISSSRRDTSLTCMMRRTNLPDLLSRMRFCTTMTSMSGSIPLGTRIGAFSSLLIASLSELAWSVARVPLWPTFIAVNRSSASLPRISPTMMRSGLMRSEFLTSASRSAFSVVSRWTVFSRAKRLISRVSSMVIIRSCGGTNAARAFSVVVFPLAVPPTIMRLSGKSAMPSTESHRNAARSASSVPFFIRSTMLIGL